MTERYRQGAEKMEAEYKRNLITAQEKEKQKAAEENGGRLPIGGGFAPYRGNGRIPDFAGGTG